MVAMNFFFGGGGKGGYLSGQVKMTPGECILGVTGLNGECCQNVVSNTHSLILWT